MSYQEGRCKKCDMDRGSVDEETGICQTCELFDNADKANKAIAGLRKSLEKSKARVKELEDKLKTLSTGAGE